MTHDSSNTPQCLPSFEEQVHFMSRQADLLDEQGHDVSANVMRDCMRMLVNEHQRADRLSVALDRLRRELSARVRTVHCTDGTPMVNVAVEALHEPR